MLQLTLQQNLFWRFDENFEIYSSLKASESDIEDIDVEDSVSVGREILATYPDKKK